MSYSDQDLRTIVRRIDRIILDRLHCYLGSVNLFNYEGTVFDQLALDYLQRSELQDRVHIFCSERPCMSPKLQRATRAHAHRRELPLVSYEKDCVVKPDRTGFISTECSAVGTYIKSFLQGKRGVQIVAALLTEDAQSGFVGMNDYFKTFSVEERCYVSNRDVQHDWHTLFLFEGCSPIDLIVAYAYHLGRFPDTSDIPLCYLHCYHERQLIKVIELIETLGPEIAAEIDRLRRAPEN